MDPGEQRCRLPKVIDRSDPVATGRALERRGHTGSGDTQRLLIEVAPSGSEILRSHDE
jgi:hypothetical protein